MKLGLDTLATHLQGGRLAPAYLVSGDEALLVGEAVDALRRSARQQGYTEREVHFPERAGDWAQIDASAGSLSLFGDRRILEVRFSGKAGKEGGAVLQRLIDAAGSDTLLLVITPRIEPAVQNTAWVKQLEARQQERARQLEAAKLAKTSSAATASAAAKHSAGRRRLPPLNTE